MNEKIQSSTTNGVGKKLDPRTQLFVLHCKVFIHTIVRTCWSIVKMAWLGCLWQRVRSAVFVKTFKKSNIIKLWTYLGYESRKVGTFCQKFSIELWRSPVMFITFTAPCTNCVHAELRLTFYVIYPSLLGHTYLKSCCSDLTDPILYRK